MKPVPDDDFLTALRNLTFAWIAGHRRRFLAWQTRVADMQQRVPEGAQAEAAVQEAWDLVDAAWPPVRAEIVTMDPVFANGHGERGTALLAVPGNAEAQGAAGAVAAILAGPDAGGENGQALLADRNYRPHRIRQVPASLAEGQDVWLADVILTRELFPAGEISRDARLACFFDPERSPSLLVPPLALVQAAMGGSTEVPADWQDAAAPEPLVRRGPPPPPVAVPPPLPPAPPLPGRLPYGVVRPPGVAYSAPRPVKRRFSVLRVVGGLAIAFVLLFVAGGLLLRGRAGGSAGSRAPGQSEFQKANLTINTPGDGVAQGNTTSAAAAAGGFSSLVKSLRETFITEGNRRAAKMSKGQFVTWCQETPDAAVFLVHVPELRNYTEEAKEAMGMMCYHAARAAVGKYFRSPPAKIVVGVRGTLFYDRVLIGKSGPAGEGVEPAVIDDPSPEKTIYHYFAPPEQEKEPAAAAAPPPR